MDGGGDHFKITGNLVLNSGLRPNSPTNPKHIKRRHYKDQSVRATFLLAVVQNIPETFENVKKILDQLDLGPIDIDDCINADLKLINILTGIQGHGSTCPCPYCYWEKNDGFKCDAADRTYGGNK